MEIADRMKGMENPIRDVLAKADELRKKGKKIYPLNIGDPNKFDFKPPENVMQAYAQAIRSDYGYASSEGLPELREAIAKKEGVSAENVLVTAGVSEGLYFTFMSLLNQGENVLIPSPFYPQYYTISKICGGTENYYEANEEWVPEASEFRKKINAKTKAIALINPNNPTGAVYPKKLVKEIIDIAGEHKIPIISDEIYKGIEYDEETIEPAKISKDVPVIALNGFSKIDLCTGYRIGYMAFHGECGKVRDAAVGLCRFRLSMNTPLQKAVLPLFEGQQPHRKETVRKLKERRDIVFKRFNEIPGMQCAKPRGAFYAFPKVEGKWKTDKEFVYDLLEQTGVLVVHGSGFSKTLKNKHFRIVFLPQPELLNEAIDKIDEFMKKS
ncbi:aminotransferase class I/II-fold pyridoxal phosphate-dependent enzyme [Candidatus Micrarchaeota archaeon]|nr:aminotransferase class I/II-fold pyridoxal phosphate-dependent enzyme [Candidatus Micrarchaeota archaeon]